MRFPRFLSCFPSKILASSTRQTGIPLVTKRWLLLPKFSSNNDQQRSSMLEMMEKIKRQMKIIWEMKNNNVGDLEKLPQEEEKLATMKAALYAEHPSGRFVLRHPKGMRDFGPREMAIREKVFKTITDCFKLHGAKAMDTPVFELKETLASKYGEEGSKLMYEFPETDGDDSLALRYDLTVPFARYLAVNGLKTLKRYQIGKVYRRDNPEIAKARYREFYQCDFDIAGFNEPLVSEAECLRVISEILTSLDLGEFEIKINHRLLIDEIFAICGVPVEKCRAVGSTIDKLDRRPWQELRMELIEVRQLKAEVADRIGEYVLIRDNYQNRTPSELIATLKFDPALSNRKNAIKGLQDLETLFKFGQLFGLDDVMVFDLSSVRGLDYYTGAIFEAVVKGYYQTRYTDSKDETSNATKAEESFDSTDSADSVESEELIGGVGSVAGGGRYDNLVGLFDAFGGGVPCVGVSIGVERIFAIVHQKLKEKEKEQNKQFRVSETQVFVASAQKKLLQERMKLCRLLWDANIKTEISHKANPKLLDQLQYCEGERIPWALIIGEDELNRGFVKIRRVETREECFVKKEDLIEEVKQRLNNVGSDDSTLL